MTNTNFSSDEIKKFDLIAPSWWDENGPMKPLHQMNPVRLKFILDNLNLSQLDQSKILDVGCGGGILAESMAKLGADVTGLDLATEAVSVAKLHALNSSSKLKVNYLNISIEDFWQNTAHPQSLGFDVITCLEMLEHVPDPESIIIHIKKLLKPGGKFFISTLNRNIKSYLMAIIGAEYVLKWLPKGTHEYNKFIKPSELADILRKHDLKILNIQGIVYNIFSKEFKLSNDIDVNYIACIG